jgi:hypothetical protein
MPGCRKSTRLNGHQTRPRHYNLERSVSHRLLDAGSGFYDLGGDMCGC